MKKAGRPVSAVFKGESLRGMLLNAYGWWKASQIMYIAALTAYGLAALALAGSAIALVRGHKAHTPTETIPATENITA